MDVYTDGNVEITFTISAINNDNKESTTTSKTITTSTISKFIISIQTVTSRSIVIYTDGNVEITLTISAINNHNKKSTKTVTLTTPVIRKLYILQMCFYKVLDTQINTRGNRHNILTNLCIIFQVMI